MPDMVSGNHAILCRVPGIFSKNRITLVTGLSAARLKILGAEGEPACDEQSDGAG
jgi:hypothetical protein